MLESKHYTAYPGQEDKIAAGIHRDEIVVKDGNIITSRGLVTVYAFAYALVDALGGDSFAFKLAEVLGRDTTELRERLLYDFAGGITA